MTGAADRVLYASTVMFRLQNTDGGVKSLLEFQYVTPDGSVEVQVRVLLDAVTLFKIGDLIQQQKEQLMSAAPQPLKHDRKNLVN